MNQGVKHSDLKVTHNYNGESSEAAELGAQHRMSLSLWNNKATVSIYYPNIKALGI